MKHFGAGEVARRQCEPGGIVEKVKSNENERLTGAGDLWWEDLFRGG
jgi:hypothetical protein